MTFPSALNRRLLELAPAALVAAVGAIAIALDAGQGRRSTHLFWLTLVLVESTIALLFRRRHPGGALAGILVAYLVVDAPAVTTAPLLLALLTVATISGPRRTALAALTSVGVVIATPIVHGGSGSLVVGLTVVAALAAAGIGMYLRGRAGTPAISGTEHVGVPHGDDVVRAARLRKRFGAATVVDNVNLRVPRGTAFGYLGPNGAGKTTLIRMLLGLTRATSGEMELLGVPVPAKRRQALARVGAIVDEPRFHKHLTGRQNLWALAAAREREAHARIDDALERVGLLERADDRVGKYSMGMRQRLGIAACLIADPELLILDEPMNGLDPAGMLELRGLIRSLVDEGRTVVLSSHLLDEVEKTCDAIAIVDRGTVVLQGRIEELTAEATPTLRLECSDPARATVLLQLRSDVDNVREEDGALLLHLVPGDPRATAAHIARVLLDAGFELYRLHPEHESLERRFLDITTRLGEAA
jgi:ABC-2 type transport system ATP-binding protein